MVEFVSTSVKSSALESMAEADPAAFSRPDSSAIKLLNSFLYDCGRAFVHHCPPPSSSKTFFPESFNALWTSLTYLRRLDERGIPILVGSKNYNFRSYSRRKIQMIFCTGMKERQMPGGRRDRSSGGGGGGGGGGGAIMRPMLLSLPPLTGGGGGGGGSGGSSGVGSGGVAVVGVTQQPPAFSSSLSGGGGGGGAASLSSPSGSGGTGGSNITIDGIEMWKD